MWPTVPYSGKEGKASIYVTADLIHKAISHKWSPKDQPSPTLVNRYMGEAGFVSLGQVDSRTHNMRLSLWTRNVPEHEKIKKARGDVGVIEVFLRGFPSQKRNPNDPRD